MLFAFKAKDAEGEIRTGSLEGASPNDVARLLTSRGLQPLEIRPAAAGTSSGRLSVPPAAPLAPPPALVPDLAPPSRLAGPPSGGGKLAPPPVWSEPPPPSPAAPTPPPAAPQFMGAAAPPARPLEPTPSPKPKPQATQAVEAAPPTRIMEAAPPTRPMPPDTAKRASAQAELEKALSGGGSTASGRLASGERPRRSPRPAAPEPSSPPAPPEPSLFERIHWQRALGALGALALILVLVLGAARFFYREKAYQIVVTGKVELFGENTGASAPSRLNTKVYLYFPELGRALRPDGRQFELEGGKLIPGQSNWTAYQDPNSRYELRWTKGGYELRATLSAHSPPTTCRVTVRKLGYTRSRGEEFPLRATSSGVLTGVAPSVSLAPSGKRTRSASPRVPAESAGGEGRDAVPMEDGP